MTRFRYYGESMTAVYLHGSLGRKYGFKAIEVTARTPRQITMMLTGMLGVKFRQAVRDGRFELTTSKRKKINVTDIGPEEVGFNISTQELHIWPVIEGASGTVRILLGVVLYFVAAFVGGPFGALLAKAALGIALGGVAELLAPKPKVSKPATQAGQNPSFIFNGTINVTEQGGPPPVVLGRVRRASSVVLSAGLTTENLPL